MKQIISNSIFILVLTTNIFSDSFRYNTYNNHGVVGLVNMPTARFFDESVYGLSIYDGTPDQKITMTSSPFNWLEASFFIRIFKKCHIQALNIKIIKIKVSI